MNVDKSKKRWYTKTNLNGRHYLGKENRVMIKLTNSIIMMIWMYMWMCICLCACKSDMFSGIKRKFNVA